jgi:hypothetical protein
MTDYNTAPVGLKEISLEEFSKSIFHYCKDAWESKQVRGESFFDLQMIPLVYDDAKKMDLGFAIMRDWYDPETKRNRPKSIIRFCRYGLDDDWNKFEGRFAAQFAGDNS